MICWHHAHMALTSPIRFFHVVIWFMIIHFFVILYMGTKNFPFVASSELAKYITGFDHYPKIKRGKILDFTKLFRFLLKILYTQSKPIFFRTGFFRVKILSLIWKSIIFLSTCCFFNLVTDDSFTYIHLLWSVRPFCLLQFRVINCFP